MPSQQPLPEPQPAPAVAPAATTLQSGQPLAPPRTTLELQELRTRRSELSSQLTSAANRREELARELRNPLVDGADRAGLEGRLRLLDQRILQLETDIATSGQQLAAAPGRLIATAQVSETFGGLPAEGVLAIGGLATLTVLAPLALATARLMWRRARGPAPLPAGAPSWEHSPRLDRLETAVDAIAVELERVSEGQRYVTRLLAEGRAAAPLPAGADETRRVPGGV